MRLEFNIFWFDDNIDEESADVIILKTFLAEDYGFDPKIHFFKTNFFEQLDETDVLQANLVLMDLNLGSDTKGDALIRHLRDKSLFSPTILYSSSGINALREVMKDLEGVFLSTRAELSLKCKKIVSATISKMQSLNNLRGLVLGEMAEIDNLMDQIITVYYVNRTSQPLVLKKYIDDMIEIKEKEAKKVLDCPCKKQCTHIYRKFDQSKCLSVLMSSKKKEDKVAFIMCKEGIDCDFLEKHSRMRDMRNHLAHAKETGGGVLEINSKCGRIFFDQDKMKEIRQELKNTKIELEEVLKNLSPKTRKVIKSEMGI